LPIALVLGACGGSTPPTVSTATPGPDAGWTGQARPMEVIHARDALMKNMELLMVPIDTIQVEPVKNADQLRVNAQAISAMLGTVPHLFPPTTNLYRPEGPEFPTLALPAIWKNFDTFYGMAMAASRTAAEMGEATTNDALRAASSKLRASCDACHMLFLRKYVPQKPQASDSGFDFDSALGTDKDKPRDKQ
jgi:cytochrome c556